MTDPGNRHHYVPSRNEHRFPDDEREDILHTGSTGSEATNLKALVDSRMPVTVVLHSGERLQGRIRYYDRDCFSLGPKGGGPKIFLRKDSVRYIVAD